MSFMTTFFNRFGFKVAVQQMGVYHSELHEMRSFIPGSVIVTDCDRTDLSMGYNIDHYYATLNSVAHWFSTNVVDHHLKITPYPLGIDYHTGARELGLNGVSPFDQEAVLIRLRGEAKPFWERSSRIYTNFNTRHVNIHRLRAHRDIPAQLVDYEPIVTPREATWKRHLAYAFIASPRGNGIDCHRTWEALALGNIVIVGSTAIDPLYEDLPVLIIKRWSDLTQDLLDQTIENYKTRTFKYEKLTLQYWISQVQYQLNKARVS